MDESSGGVTGPGAAAAIVLRQSRVQRDGLFGALTAAFLVALARGYAGAQTTTGRVVVIVFVSVVTAVLVLGWVRLIRIRAAWRSPRRPSRSWTGGAPGGHCPAAPAASSGWCGWAAGVTFSRASPFRARAR
jgi:hypothetical protein